MAIFNTKLLLCVIAGLATIAATLVEMQKSDAERDAAMWRHVSTQRLVPAGPCSPDWDAIDKRSKEDMKALKDGFKDPPQVRFSHQLP